MWLHWCSCSPAEIWFACAVFVAGVLGLALSGPVRMSAASGQRHGGQLTLGLLLSSLSVSTGLGHSAPLGCAQPPQLSGNGGCRQGSASHFSWPNLRPLSYSQPLQLLTSPSLSQLLRSAGVRLTSSLSSGLWTCLHRSVFPPLENLPPPLLPPLVSGVGKGPLLTSLCSASPPLGPLGRVTSE